MLTLVLAHLAALALPAPAPQAALHAATADAVQTFSRDWVAKAEDNVCGLRDVTQVSNPAVIDFQACLDATPEMKKVKAEKIDLKSPEGIRLLADATSRVTQACESVQRAHGYCSIWKAIKHKDGRTITDISSLVTALF